MGSDSEKFPEPANSVSGALGLTNLDFLKFVPAECKFTGMSYYDTLLIKTVGPMVVIALLWTWPASRAIQSKYAKEAAKNAARMSLTLLKLVYVSVSTSIFQCACSSPLHWRR